MDNAFDVDEHIARIGARLAPIHRKDECRGVLKG